MKTTLALASALALALSSLAVQAQEISTDETDNINVMAEVTEACSELTANDLDFGSAPQPSATVVDDQTFTITVTCAAGREYTLELDYGSNPASAGSSQRQVGNTGNNDFMDYTIFQPNASGAAATSIEWGSEAIEPGSSYVRNATGTQQTLTATGRLDRTSDSSPGLYTDVVTVTLSF